MNPSPSSQPDSDDDPLCFSHAAMQQDPLLAAQLTNGLFRAFHRRTPPRNVRWRRWIEGPDAGIFRVLLFVPLVLGTFFLLTLPTTLRPRSPAGQLLYILACVSFLAFLLRNLLPRWAPRGQCSDSSPLPVTLKQVVADPTRFASIRRDLALCADSREWAEAMYLADRLINERVRLDVLAIITAAIIFFPVVAGKDPVALVLLPMIAWLVREMILSRTATMIGFSAGQNVLGVPTIHPTTHTVPSPRKTTPPHPRFAASLWVSLVGAALFIGAITGQPLRMWTNAPYFATIGLVIGFIANQLRNSRGAAITNALDRARATLPLVAHRLDFLMVEDLLADPDTIRWHLWLHHPNRSPHAPSPEHDKAFLDATGHATEWFPSTPPTPTPNPE